MTASTTTRHAAPVARTRTRRCVSRGCGRYFGKVEFSSKRCDSCGRLMRWSPMAWYYVATKKLRRRR